jgi:hypothetical protein
MWRISSPCYGGLLEKCVVSVFFVPFLSSVWLDYNLLFCNDFCVPYMLREMVLFAGVVSSAEIMKFFGSFLRSDNQDVSFAEEKNVCKNGRNPCGFWVFLPVKLRETLCLHR